MIGYAEAGGEACLQELLVLIPTLWAPLPRALLRDYQRQAKRSRGERALQPAKAGDKIST